MAQCNICQLEDDSTMQRPVLAGEGNLVKAQVMACDYCAREFKDRDDPVQKARQEAIERVKPQGWPEYATFPPAPGKPLPPGWVWDERGIHLA